MYYKSDDTQMMDIMCIFIFIPMFNFIQSVYINDSKVVCYALCHEYEHFMKHLSRILFRAIMQGEKNNIVSEPYFFLY